jgi:hypothetical protein
MKLMSFKFGTGYMNITMSYSRVHYILLKHINYKTSQALEILGLIRFITYNSFLDMHKILYVSYIKSKLQCT